MKTTEYGLRLREKQKLRRLVSMTETPFRRVFTRATASPTHTGQEFLRLLQHADRQSGPEPRPPDPRTARQLVLHGHIRVNGRPVTVPSYSVGLGESVSLDPRMRDNLAVRLGLEAASRRSGRPSFLSLNEAELSGQLVRWPTREEMSFPVQEHLIVEYYSK